MSPAKLKLINTMKLRTLLIGCFGGFIMLNSCTESPSVKDYSAYVNPFIGSEMCIRDSRSSAWYDPAESGHPD